MPETTTPPNSIDPTIKLVLKTVSQSGEQVAISASVRILSLPSYQVIADKPYITQAETVNFDITTAHVPNGTELFWSISTNEASSADFTTEEMEGVVVITDNIALVTKTTVDYLYYTTTQSYIYLNLYTDSAKEILVARSKRVIIYLGSGDAT